MVNVSPVLWGPPLWQACLACAWHAKDMSALEDFLHRLLPLMLPCETCRQHFLDKRTAVDRKTKKSTRPGSHTYHFTWLYHLKDHVNQTTRHRSITLDDLTQRFLLHRGSIDDVTFGDALVLIALDAHDRKLDDVFVQFCASLVVLLPLPSDSCLMQSLSTLHSRPIVPQVHRAAKAARCERGLPELPLTHYKALYES